MTRFVRPFVLTLGALAVAAACLPAQAAGQPGGGRGAGPGRFFGGPGGPGGLNMLMLATDPAVQKKLGIEDKKGAVDELATRAREARGQRGGGMGNFRDMTEEERAKAFEKMRADREKAQKETEDNLKKLLGEAKFNELVEVRAGLMLTQQGPAAVIDPGIAAILKLTDEQKKQIQEVVDKLNEQRRELFGGMRGGRRGGAAGGPNAGGPNVSSRVIFVAAPAGGADRPDFTQIREKMAELQKTANAAIAKILTADQKAKVKELMAAVEGVEIQRRGFGGMRGGPGGGPEGAPGGRRGGQGGRRGAAGRPGGGNNQT